jgi:hypothetical protein
VHKTLNPNFEAYIFVQNQTENNGINFEKILNVKKCAKIVPEYLSNIQKMTKEFSLSFFKNDRRTQLKTK